MKTRNRNLDALRAVAILLVLGRHFEYFRLWSQVGWAGVDLFFVLSGFLISGLLFAEWKGRGSIGIARFYVRRGLKIYPAFYVFLAMTAVAEYIWPGFTFYPITRAHALAEMLFFQSYQTGIWGHTWSLAVEEHFYIALPLLLWVMVAIGRGRNEGNPFGRLPVLFLAVALVDLMLRFWNGWKFSGQYAVYLIPSHLRADALLFGVLLSYYRHFQPDTFRRIGCSYFGYVIMAIALALILAFPLEHPIMHTIGFTFMFLGFGCLLAKVIDREPGPYGLLIIKPLASVGAYSYSIYLWHLSISRLVTHSGPLAFWFYLSLCIGVGVLMAALIESPGLMLRERFFPVHTMGMRREQESNRIAAPTVERNREVSSML